MMKSQLLFLILLIVYPSEGFSQDARKKNFPLLQEIPEEIPDRENFWIFFLAGQSNMAGRGFVEPQDTLPDSRILSMSRDNKWVIAKEPLHFYQPDLTGLDCGLAFARELLKYVPDSIVIGLIPCAVGGTSVTDWLSDLPVNNIRLKTNFGEKADLVRDKGVFKGILWHQGEADATIKRIPFYSQRLDSLFVFFREYLKIENVPLIMGELGSFPLKQETRELYSQLNDILRQKTSEYNNCSLVNTSDLKPKEDNAHFDSGSLRIMGRRYADAFLEIAGINKPKSY